MVRTRGHSVTEVVVATSLLVVLLAALLPPPRGQAAALRDLLEAETARLLVEGELTLARQEAAWGALAPGPRDPARWPSASTLRGLELSLRASPGEDGLLQVEVEARWRPLGRGPDAAPRRLRLATLVRQGRAP